jgi:8-oxo-dGTP pyrophosphatase MutT (NUDIX family)
MKFVDNINLILESDDDFDSSVAIVKSGNKWLLGLSTSKDDRKRKWAFPGGGIKKNETPQKAAERECFEETGIRCKSKGPIMTHDGKKGVAFVPCVLQGEIRFKPNSEFSALGFFETSDFDSLELYRYTEELIRRARRHY